MKKYELTNNTKEWEGKTLYQIRALIDFGNVKAGELGGYIENEKNLSHDGDAWVYGNAQVCGDAWVCNDARVYGNAWVYGNARVYGNANYLVIGPIGSRNAFTTFYRNKDEIIMVVCGCFHGTIDEFADQVAKTHGNNEHAKAYKAAIQLAKIRVRTEPAKEEEDQK